MWNLPNILTIIRIIMIPFIIGLLFIDQAWAVWSCLALYAAAAITDYFDGYFARKMKLSSAFGQFMDPIADKLLIATLIVALAGFNRIDDYWLIPAIIIIMREFMISGLREFLGPQNIQIPVSKLAKWKTTVQMIALGFLITGEYGEALVPYALEIGQWGLAVAAALTVITGWNYMKVGMQHIIRMDKEEK